MFQHGIQLYWHSIGTPQAIKTRADELLDYIVGLGADSVGITFSIYTDGAYPTKVYAGTDTPTPAQLGLVVAAAKLRGLRVMLRPTINEVNIAASKPGGWRGNIEPQNVGRWFASYDRLLLRYAPLAVRDHVDEFVAGTELFSMQGYTPDWTRLKRLFRHRGYHGVLSYAINWDSGDNVPFGTLGVDAYPAIDLGDTATVAQLSAALTSWFDQQPYSLRRRLTVQEAGIAALHGMYAHPWEWGTVQGPLDLRIQANWFSAVCSAAKASHVRGLYYWSIDSDTYLPWVHPRTDYSGSFVGRPAADSIKRCFGG